MSDMNGNVLYTPGLHFGFNFPAFLIVMLLTMVLVRGIRESAESQQHHGHPENLRDPRLHHRGISLS